MTSDEAFDSWYENEYGQKPSPDSIGRHYFTAGQKAAQQSRPQMSEDEAVEMMLRGFKSYYGGIEPDNYVKNIDFDARMRNAYRALKEKIN